MVLDRESGYEPIEDSFPVVMFGYNREAVDAHIEDLAEQIRVLSRDNRRLAAMAQELADAQEEIRKLRHVAVANGPAMAAGAGIAELMRTAEAEALKYRAQAQNLIAEAQTEADRLRREARADANLAAVAWREEVKREAPQKHLVTAPAPKHPKRRERETD